MSVRVFLDANVLFSAAYLEQGSMRAFFDLADAGACSLVSSAHAIEEARRNIASRYPSCAADLDRLVSRLEVCPEPQASTVGRAAKHGLPAKDAPILAAAIEAGCHVLATGDRRDFGALFGRRVEGTIVMLPTDAIEMIVG